MMFTLLSQAKSWEFAEAEVRIGLGDERLAKVFTDTDRQTLENLCGAVLGRKVKLSFIEDRLNSTSESPAKHRAARSPVQSNDAPKQTSASAASRLSQDPEVAEFEQLFGARAKMIRNWKE